MKITAPSYFQCPNDLVDHWMPLLGEAELRVLLLIIRKTFGWHKERDRISLSQMVQKTGLSKSNVCTAITSLIEKDLILKEIEGVLGTEKVFYSLVVKEIPTCPEAGPPQSCSSTPPSPVTGHTKETPTKDTKKSKKEPLLASPSPSTPYSIESDPAGTIYIDQIPGSNPLWLPIDSLLKDRQVPQSWIDTIRRLGATFQEVKTALQCADEYQPQDLGSYLYKAIQEKWQPKKHIEEVEVKNRDFVEKKLRKLDGTMCGNYRFTVGSKYVEFSQAANCEPVVFEFDDRNFEKEVTKFIMENKEKK